MFKLIPADLNDFETQLENELRFSVAFIEAIGEDLVETGDRSSARVVVRSSRAGSPQKISAVDAAHSSSFRVRDIGSSYPLGCNKPIPRAANLGAGYSAPSSRPYTVLTMFDLIQSDLSDFEARLTSELYSSVEFIGAIGEDLVGAGGKRLRPSLAFLAGQLLGAEREAAMRVALAVELLHSASLLHDDLIDDANTRRGVDAAFRRYGNIVSVMSGDFMLARVLGILATSGSSSFTRLMSETAASICEAEVLQFQMATLETYSVANYETIIEGKTAALLAAALEGVALLSGAPEVERRALRDFGLHYGRAFQMQDDLLDLTGDAAALGKPTGGDLREGKATFAVLKLLEEGVKEAQTILRRHASEDGDVPRMLALVRAHGADARAKAEVEREAAAAIAVLAPFPESFAKGALESLAQRELARVR